MKILLITQHYPPEIGAASNRMFNLSYFLTKYDHQVTVLTNEPTYPKKEIYEKEMYKENIRELKKIKVLRVKNPFDSYSNNKIKRLLLYITFIVTGIFKLSKIKNNFDLIIISSPPIFVGILGVLAKSRFKCKLYSDIRDLWPDSIEALGIFRSKIFLKPFYILEKFIYENSDKIIINSKGFKEMLLKKKQLPSKIIYLPNGIRKEKLEKIHFIKKSKYIIRVIYAGNIGYAQDLRTLIEAANILRNYKKIRFAIIGTGVCFYDLKNLAEKKKLSNIEFLGAIPRERVLEELLQSHIALLHLKNSKIFETVIPSKIFDYMAAKLPIVAGVKGEAERILKESNSAYICEPGNSSKMAEYIIRLAKNEHLRKIKGDNGYEYLSRNFILDERMKEFNNLILKETI